METTQNKLTSIGESIGAEGNRQLDELIARGSKLKRFSKDISALIKDCALVTDQYVRENSWKAVGMGAVLGLILGCVGARTDADSRQRRTE